MLMTGSPSWICFVIHRTETEPPHLSQFHGLLRPWFTCTTILSDTLLYVYVQVCLCMPVSESEWPSGSAVSCGNRFQRRGKCFLLWTSPCFPAPVLIQHIYGGGRLAVVTLKCRVHGIGNSEIYLWTQTKLMRIVIFKWYEQETATVWWQRFLCIEIELKCSVSHKSVQYM